MVHNIIFDALPIVRPNGPSLVKTHWTRSPGTLFTKQLTQIPSFLRSFLMSVVWLCDGQIFVFVGHFDPLLMDFKCYYYKFALNIC